MLSDEIAKTVIFKLTLAQFVLWINSFLQVNFFQFGGGK